MVQVFCYFNAGTHVSPYRLPRTSKRTKTACAAHDFNALFSQQPFQPCMMLLGRFSPCAPSSSGAQKMSMIQVPSSGDLSCACVHLSVIVHESMMQNSVCMRKNTFDDIPPSPLLPNRSSKMPVDRVCALPAGGVWKGTDTNTHTRHTKGRQEHTPSSGFEYC